MNPFNFDSQFDNALATIIAKIHKSTIINIEESLKALLTYLPNSNLNSDYHIVVKTIKPLIDSPAKQIVNKIVYYLAKKVGTYSINEIAVPWLYLNFDSSDPYALKVIEKYLDIKGIAKEAVSTLKWSDYLRDLSFFKFLFANSPSEISFDVSKLPCASYLELDLIYDILFDFKSKYPIEIMKISELSKSLISKEQINNFFNNDREKERNCTQESHQPSNCNLYKESPSLNEIYHNFDMFSSLAKLDKSIKSSKMIVDLFYKVRQISTSILINKKQKILLKIFDYYDESIYQDAMSLDSDLFKILSNKTLDFDRLLVPSVDAANLVINKVKNLEIFILNNLEGPLCIFELFEKIGFSHEFYIENKDKFKRIANDSMHKHFGIKSCTSHSPDKSFKVNEKTLEFFFDSLDGKNKIVAASILKKQLDPKDFNFKEINDNMEHAIEVFPKEFFIGKEFIASAYYFYKKYPQELESHIRSETIHKFISNFTKTKPEHIVKLLSDLRLLKIYLQNLPIEVIQRLSKINTVDEFKIAYLFHCRDTIDQVDVDYSVVFEEFFTAGFIKYLISTHNNLSSFQSTIIDYISNIKITNSCFYTGYNFDYNPEFYYNVNIPSFDSALLVLYDVLSNSKLPVELQVTKHLIEVILVKKISISKELNEKLMSSEFVLNYVDTIDLKQNSFILKRFKDEYIDKINYSIPLSNLEINRKKTQDILLRSFEIPAIYLSEIDTSYLSMEACRNLVNSISQYNFLSDKNDHKIIKTSKYIDIDEQKLATELGRMSIQTNEAEEDKNISDEVSDVSTNYQKLIERYFMRNTHPSILDYGSLIENDKVLDITHLRESRLETYKPLIKLLAEGVVSVFLNLYNVSKLEAKADNDTIFEMLIEPIKKYKKIFWILISKALNRIGNLYVCAFIEEMLLKHCLTKSSEMFKQDGIISIEDYYKIATDPEIATLSLALPNIFSYYRFKRKLPIESYIMEMTNTKIDNGKISFSKTNEIYKLRFCYRADSLVHEATINIPVAFPNKKARIEYSTTQKSLKFYHKLNEILSKTSKFVEIFFMWKVDIDNHLIGYNECLICYFIMDPKTKQLPKFKCHVCNNSFHDKCIYRWAAESKKVSCPFCRSELNLWKKDHFDMKE